MPPPPPAARYSNLGNKFLLDASEWDILNMINVSKRTFFNDDFELLKMTAFTFTELPVEATTL